MTRTRWVAMLAAFAFVAFTSTAMADLIPPTSGTTGFVAPDTLSAPSGTPVATTTSTVTQTSSTTTLNVTFTESVYANQSNPGCTFAGGCLTFVITATNNSASNTDLLNVTNGPNFGPYTIDVGDTGTGSIPGNVNESSGVVNFYGLAPTVAPGSSTGTLVIETSAANYASGPVSFQDGSTVNGTGFVPAPEPSSFALLALVLLSGLFVVRKRAFAL